MKKLNWLFLMFLTVTFISCEDEEDEITLDNTGPVIAITSPNSGAEFYPGEPVPVQGTVEDDVELDEVTISINGPGLNNTFTRRDGEAGVNFDQDRIYNINTTVPLPADLEEGNYVITVNAVDAQGNVATQRSVTIEVLPADNVAPEVTILTPETGQVFAIGETFAYTANVEDNMNIREIRITAQSGSQDPVFTETISEEDLEGLTTFDLADEFAIPDNAAIAPYTFTIEAEDFFGNVNEDVIEFEVEEGQ